LISFNRSTPLGVLVDDAFLSAGETRKVDIEVRYSQTACALVDSGAGVALVDEFSVMGDMFHRLVVRPFVPQVKLSVSLVYNRYRPMSALAARFATELQEFAKRLADEGRSARNAKGSRMRSD
jgi:DNA-binding transcriptional LysR family regulator